MKLRVLFALSRPNCVFCDRPVRLVKKGNNAGQIPDNAASLDHKMPICRGGTNHHENLHITCHKCNMAKADMTTMEFIEFCKTKKFLPSYIEWLEIKWMRRL